MFFRLLPEVYLVLGKNKSLLQNVLTKRVLWVDNVIAKFIRVCENNEPVSNEFLKYAQELEKNNWGKITLKPIFVEKLRLVNICDKRQIHKKAPVISHATIKLTDKCNLNCNKCGQVFCPPCIKDNTSENLPLSQIKNTILNIKNYGCKTIVLTGGEIALVPYLKEIYSFIIENGLNVILNTNGVKKLDDFFIDANILISIFSCDSIDTIISNYKRFKNITLLKYFNSDKKLVLPTNWKFASRTSDIHKITRKSLLNMSIDKFHLRRTKNSCLNGKIVINQAGNVYPCLESIKSSQAVGNVNNQIFGDIIKILSDKFWEQKINNHKICFQCEFRYVCNSCIFDNVEKNCCYDMEAKVWK